MSEGLLRLATTVELALNAPSHSTMGSIAHDISPTYYELLKDTRNAIRILGARITNGLEYMHKIGFEIVESLSREQRIEAMHEKAVRKYLKNIKVVSNLVQAAVATEDPGESQSFTKAMIRYMSLVKSAQAEFEAHFASHTEPSPLPTHGPRDQDGTPLSPSNTFHNPCQNTHGNPHDEKGVDETLSEAMEHYESQLPPMDENSATNLKDPPEQIYPSLMMEADCVPANLAPQTEEQLVVVATMASQGQIVIAEPVCEEEDDEEQLEVAKTLSLSEFQNDERKPAATQQPPMLSKRSPLLKSRQS
jgi:hypothetical protein